MTTNSQTATHPASTDLQAAAAGAYRYRVEVLRVASPVVLEVGLAPVGEHLPFRPGQHAMLSVREPGVPERAY